MDGLIVNGTFIAGRSCNSRFGTRSPNKLRLLMPYAVIEPHFDKGKHLYWKATTRRGEQQAQRMGLLRLPYPKPRHIPNDRVVDDAPLFAEVGG